MFTSLELRLVARSKCVPVLRDAVAEIILAGIPALIDEGQDRNRRPVRPMTIRSHRNRGLECGRRRRGRVRRARRGPIRQDLLVQRRGYGLRVDIQLVVQAIPADLVLAERQFLPPLGAAAGAARRECGALSGSASHGPAMSRPMRWRQRRGGASDCEHPVRGASDTVDCTRIETKYHRDECLPAKSHEQARTSSNLLAVALHDIGDCSPVAPRSPRPGSSGGEFRVQFWTSYKQTLKQYATLLSRLSSYNGGSHFEVYFGRSKARS
jgi:hypothetical protein